MVTNERKRLAVAAKGGDNEEKTKRLLREIVEHIEASPPPQASAEEGQDILLNVQIDGQHYKLIRCNVGLPTQVVQLSPREEEVVRMVAKGLPNKAIAQILDISPWTVATYLRRIFQKLAVNTRAEMVAYVLKNNLLQDAA